MNRIKPVDGLRAFAVLGVIWSHVWMFFGNLPLAAGGLNINQFLSFGGIGVDLFFVISGFCMYLMHSRESTGFSLYSYGRFLKKRWFRIAPAFYFIVLFECVTYLAVRHEFPYKDLLYHLFFINIFDPGSVLSPPFWSLSTEWHFYIILPLLFILDPRRDRLIPRLALLMGACMVFRLELYRSFDPLHAVTLPADPIWFRFIEFAWGILAAWLYQEKKEIPGWWKGNLGFLLSLAIAFTGRLCMTTNVLVHLGRVAFLVRSLAEPILTLGFAMMILNLVLSESIFRRLVSARPFLFIGKISYSMYLWHWMIAYEISAWWILHIGGSTLQQELAFITAVLFCIPMAMLSYKYLEAPYFKRNKRATVPAPAAYPA